ncbi:type I-C CRISPR-associated protein Cas8c/Csd1 [Deinococcus petrolearius]|uniref:Type I-C CRISPR-associated protein Cas8c/Csd1 n=1 Tax=Deinococcus petrolearius TaxID=1751295 RepID=A0ABW1DLP2_9DEIO
MLDALVKYAQDEEFGKSLPPTGFYNYSQPIRWVVQISEDSARLEESNVSMPRPYTGRAGRNFAPHPFADEASYALGINLIDDEEIDADAKTKNSAFLELMDEISDRKDISQSLSTSIALLRRCISENWLANDSRLHEVRSKDWVAFAVPRIGEGFQRLFETSEAKDVWVSVAKDRTAVRDKKGEIVAGECAVCGQVKPLVSRIPVGVKLISKPGPLHSLNSNAFVSGRTDIKGHVNLCYECADTASRAFNALSGSKQHRRIIVVDKVGNKVKSDTLRNQVALFWVEKGDAAQVAGDFSFKDALSTLYSADVKVAAAAEPFDFESALGDLMRPPVADDSDPDGDAEEQLKAKAKKGKKATTNAPAPPRPEARLGQLSSLLNVQNAAGQYMTYLDGGKFALAIFSPNVGRTALREWLHLDLGRMLPRVRAYLNATTINNSWGASGEPQHINALMEALGSKNVNLTRDLIRTAYQGTPPPLEMLAQAVQRFRTLTVKGALDNPEKEKIRGRHLKTLAAALKFSLYYTETAAEGGAKFMTGLERLESDPAYLCGRLLAVLEEAQQVYSYRQNKKRLKTTGVQRSFGAASASPAGIFPKLVKLATVAHLPKAGKFLNTEMEGLVRMLVERGGYPMSLNVEGQGRFGLGYWHQRGDIRANWTPEEKTADEQAENTPEGDEA